MAAIQLYNTLSRQLEALRPPTGEPLGMYTCGLTVYDYGHIGNFRTFIAVDVLQRFLLSEGYQLNAVLNLTDIDDKIIERARTAGHGVGEHAAIYARAFEQDMELLGLRQPEHLVRATAHIEAMVAWCDRLIATGHAYISQGSVYFRVASFPAYGALSGKDAESLLVGARVESGLEQKEDARDFVLWKAHKPGEPSWPSPWGPGRPGWHIECSVMAMHYLGASFDLHAGGADLVFPHHENEIAQAEAVTGERFVRHWFHVEFLLVESEKMSKSLGNYYTVRDLIARGVKPSALRYLLASVPPRRSLNFTHEGLEQSAAAVERLTGFRDRLRRNGENQPPAGADRAVEWVRTARENFRAALADNLNTAAALGAVFEMVRAGNAALDAGEMTAQAARAALDFLAYFDGIFGVLGDEDQARLAAYALGTGLELSAPALDMAAIEARLAERAAARARRDYSRSDELRRELEQLGVVVEDVKGGEQKWRVKK